MNKKKLFIYLSTLFAVCLIMPSLPFGMVAEAQTATVKTTLSAAVTSLTATTIVVSSATGFVASTGTQEYDVWFDGELEKVLAINGTTISIGRNGQQNTKAGLHPNGAFVYFGPAGRAGPFVRQVPTAGTNCTSTQFPVLPLVNVTTGDVFTCTGSIWLTLHATGQASDVHSRTTVSDAAYTALITDEIIAYTCITASRVVLLPNPSGFAGKTLILKDESGSATGTITISASAGALKVDGSATTLKTVNSNFGVLRLYTDGTNWFTW